MCNVMMVKQLKCRDEGTASPRSNELLWVYQREEEGGWPFRHSFPSHLGSQLQSGAFTFLDIA